MSKAVLIINGVDFSRRVARGGITVSYEQRVLREVVTLDGTSHTACVEKANISVSMREMPFELVNRLSAALEAPYVSVQYQDPKRGTVTRKFSASDKKFGVLVVEAGRTYYDSITFNLRER